MKHYYPGPQDSPPPWMSVLACRDEGSRDETPAAEEDGTT